MEPVCISVSDLKPDWISESEVKPGWISESEIKPNVFENILNGGWYLFSNFDQDEGMLHVHSVYKWKMN